jgi:thiamine-phosphate pyrophosphorylase
MKIYKLHYITQSLHGKSHAEMAEEACKSGVNWVQLRMKNCSEEELLDEAIMTKIICQKYGAKLIINDHVEIAKEIDAHGVHLGKTDISPEKARSILGDQFIIGGTANTLDDIIELHNQEVDYIGLGPFQFTSTKDNLSPVLGLIGYQKIIKALREKGIDTPVIAIGGIQINDIRSLLEEGIHGVAIASLINESNDKKDTIQKIVNELNYGEITHSR